MNLVDFATYIVTNMVKNPDMVKISSLEDDDKITLEIIVSNSDMPSLIGKEGKNAKALRTIIRTFAYQNNIKHVKVNIDSF